MDSGVIHLVRTEDRSVANDLLQEYLAAAREGHLVFQRTPLRAHRCLSYTL